MSFIPDITCRRCGKKFSAIHGRCPHCGAKKVTQVGRPPVRPSAGTDSRQPEASASAGRRRSGGSAAYMFQSNARWQLLFGCILLLLVIVAVIVLISTSLKGARKPAETPPPPPVEVTSPPPTTAPPTPSPTPTVPVSSVAIITVWGEPVKEFTQRVEWADIQLKAEVYPVEALSTAKVEWRSTNEDVATVDETGLVHAVATGVAEIIAECGGVAVSCKVAVP